MRLSTRGSTGALALSLGRRLLVIGGAVLIAALVAGPRDIRAAEEHKSCDVAEAPKAPAKGSKAPAQATAAQQSDKPVTTGPQAKQSQQLKGKTLADGREPQRVVTLRGEIVDYFCYIQKGATGPAHRDCGVRCVAGDVCMGLLTTDDRLMMISVNHMRAMNPIEYKGIPDPFNACRTLIAEQVDLTGNLMERKGQRIIEVLAVKPVPKAVPASKTPAPKK